MPGKVPRGSFPPERATPHLAPLHRYILDKLDRGVVLLDAVGAVVDANSLAQRVIAGNHGLTLRNGRLAFTDPAHDARLVRLLSAGRAATGGRSIAAAVRSDGRAPCRVVVASAGAHDARRVVRFVVLLYGTDGLRSISVDVLAEVYGLTRAQARVARRLYAGDSVEQTAVQLRLSPNTVRTHLKQIFSKCNVQSQAELLHMLATGPRSL